MESGQKEGALLRTAAEGLLCKYTNMVKGWQYRWFVVNAADGFLEYHEKEEYKGQRPRGCLPLAGAVVAPSDEDSVTFIVHSRTGEVYRLRANDAKSRQFWVNRLRYIAEEHGKRVLDREQAFREERMAAGSDRSRASTATESASDLPDLVAPVAPYEPSSSFEVTDPMQTLQGLMHDIYEYEEKLSATIESLPAGGAVVPLDRELLLLKASSKSAVACIEQCLHVLLDQQNSGHIHREQSIPRQKRHHTPLVASTTLAALPPVVNQNESQTAPVTADVLPSFADEVEDVEEYTERELGTTEEHKSVILQVLSQLKYGMDLTKVVLPTFILEKKSLLEMFADCMSHGQLLVAIGYQPSAEERMLHVLVWYLTAFHRTRLGSVAKKPYNPIIGETFTCSWIVPEEDCRASCRIRYCAEQVSHHPPVSAFYLECPEAKVCLNASFWTKSKYMGMAIGVNMVGSMTLSLVGLQEDYVMTLPSAYARSILSHPFVELSDRVCITCKESGYNAAVVFHTKPFYGGKLHRITGEVKNSEGAIIYKVSGEWNGAMEFTNASGAVIKSVVCDSLPILRKRVVPLDLQKGSESRKMWASVTGALCSGNMEQAALFKSQLEDMQREGEKDKAEYGLPHYAKYFQKHGEDWLFKNAMSLPKGT